MPHIIAFAKNQWYVAAYSAEDGAPVALCLLGAGRGRHDDGLRVPVPGRPDRAGSLTRTGPAQDV